MHRDLILVLVLRLTSVKICDIILIVYSLILNSMENYKRPDLWPAESDQDAGLDAETETVLEKAGLDTETVLEKAGLDTKTVLKKAGLDTK